MEQTEGPKWCQKCPENARWQPGFVSDGVCICTEEFEWNGNKCIHSEQKNNNEF